MQEKKHCYDRHFSERPRQCYRAHSEPSKAINDRSDKEDPEKSGHKTRRTKGETMILTTKGGATIDTSIVYVCRNCFKGNVTFTQISHGHWIAECDNKNCDFKEEIGMPIGRYYAK